MAGGKYHLGKDGMPKRCRANKVACPLGSISDHYNTIDEAQIVADDIYEQLSTSNGFGIAVNGGTQRIDNRTEIAIARLNNLKIVLNRLENIKNNARQDILTELSNKNIKSLKAESGTLSFVAGSTRIGVDTERLKESGEYENYSKQSIVSEHIKMMSGDEPHEDGSELTENQAKIKKFRRRMETPSGKSLDFELEINDDGTANISFENEEAIQKLKHYEETLSRLKDLDKALRNDLMESMKEKNISVIRSGEAALVYNPETSRTIVDSAKLKADGKYAQYSKETVTKDSLRIKFN